MKQITVIDQTTLEQFDFYDNSEDTIINNTDGFEYGSVQPVFEDVPGFNGQVFITSRFGSRKFSWGGDLVASDVFQQRRDMAVPMGQDGVLRLIKFTGYDDIELQMEAVISRVLMPYTHSIHTYMIECIAPDFRLYSQELKTFTTAETLYNFGTPIPATVPMDLNGGADSIYDVTNEGNEETDPTFTIAGAGSNFRVLNETTGDAFYLDLTLVDGDEVVVGFDNGELYVIKNGTDNAYADFSGECWSLAPGVNRISFAAIDGGSDDNTLLTIEYRDAYRGV